MFQVNEGIEKLVNLANEFMPDVGMTPKAGEAMNIVFCKEKLDWLVFDKERYF